MPKNPYFKEIYKRYSPILYKFIAKHTGQNQKIVEEILEDTLVSAWAGFGTFKHKSSYFTWLCRIALNKIADYYRDQVNSRSRIITPGLKALSNMEDKSASPEEKLALQELRDKVNKCLSLLPAEKRRLLQFRYWYDYSYSKIANILGISERAVEGQIYRAKHEFAKAWLASADFKPKNS